MMVESIPITTPEEMYRAEQAIIAAGTPGFELMRRAGKGVADAIIERYPIGRLNVLCGPGGNGGDGFIAAAQLAERGWKVRVFLLGDVERLAGDPAKAAALWLGPIEPIGDALTAQADVTLDALFGGGLSRPLTGVIAELAQSQASPMVSVDVPSGIDGRSAKPLGPCFSADLTVTFAAYRPAHVLAPARSNCGDVVVVDICVPVDDSVIARKETSIIPSDAIHVEDDAELKLLCAGYNLAPMNRIEAITMLSKSRRQVIFLRQPDPILARIDLQTIVFIA